MGHYSSDTPAEIEKVQFDLLRRVPSWRKLEMVAQMNNAVLSLAMSGLRLRHAHESEDRLRRRLADLTLGVKLANKLFDPPLCER